MAELIDVTAARPHRSGYAAKGRVEKGDSYRVPAERVALLVRAKLVARRRKGRAAKRPA